MKLPFATRSVYGWALNRPVGQPDVRNATCFHVTLEQRVENLWALENRDSEDLCHSAEDRKVLDLWESEISLRDCHYTLPIPWKDGQPAFPNNKGLAIGRLQSQVTRLNKVGLMKTYDDNVTNMVSNGYAERVPESELNLADGSVWYLPHHHVVSDSKPGKILIVFDCAAKYQDICCMPMFSGTWHYQQIDKRALAFPSVQICSHGGYRENVFASACSASWQKCTPVPMVWAWKIDWIPNDVSPFRKYLVLEHQHFRFAPNCKKSTWSRSHQRNGSQCVLRGQFVKIGRIKRRCKTRCIWHKACNQERRVQLDQIRYEQQWTVRSNRCQWKGFWGQRNNAWHVQQSPGCQMASLRGCLLLS